MSETAPADQLRVYWLPNQRGAWLVRDDGAEAWYVVPNRIGGWGQRQRYAGTVLPRPEDRVPAHLERIVWTVVGADQNDLLWLGALVAWQRRQEASA